jgi:hypothetical protein
MNVDDRIRAALRARAEQLAEADLRPAAPPTGGAARSRMRWTAPLLAAAAVAAVAIATAVVSSQPQAGKHAPPAGSSPVPSTGTPTGASSATSKATPTNTSATATAVPKLACYFADVPTCSRITYYVPLWPFSSYAQARQWQQSGGSQPWHLDARLTARYFVRSFLGFTDLGVVTSARISADEAHIGVGYKDANGGNHTAAVLHLVRYERELADTSAPWEVVGTDDTTFSIEGPGYGTHVLSPLRVSGHITGVDENIHVWVRSAAGLLGQKCCLPAGGDHHPWSAQVAFGTKPGAPLTLVASTGGHLIEHERFAVQGAWAA